MSQFAGDAAAVVVAGLSYTFAGREARSLDNVSCALDPGSWTLVAGKTGSGKSTLLRALAGLIPQQATGTMHGTVRLFGLDTRSARPLELARTAGLVLQSPDEQICTTTVADEVAFGLANLRLSPTEIDERLTLWLDRLGLTAQRQQSTQTLSGGQKSRLLLASVLAMGPRLLLLDEPLAQLDYAGAVELLDLLDVLRRAGLTIVVAEHRYDDLAGRVDRVLVLDRGKVVADQPARATNLATSLCAAGLIVSADTRGAAPALATASADPTALSEIARVERISQQFPRQPTPLWADISFRIEAGEQIALVGANGCGKSTLLHALAGFVRPTSGALSVAAAGPGRVQLALVPQNPDLTLFCRTVREELAFGPQQLGLAEAKVRSRVHEAAEAMAVLDLLEEPPLALSQGQRLRVALAAALTLRPQLLMLDEPTTGQDPAEVRRLMAAVRAAVLSGALGAALFTTHDVLLVTQVASRALVIADGRLIADGEAAELMKDQNALLRARLIRRSGAGDENKQSPLKLPAGPDQLSRRSS